MSDETDRVLMGLLIVACLGVALLIGQYQQRLDRENGLLHARVEASRIPPSTNFPKSVLIPSLVETVSENPAAEMRK